MNGTNVTMSLVGDGASDSLLADGMSSLLPFRTGPIVLLLVDGGQLTYFKDSSHISFSDSLSPLIVVDGQYNAVTSFVLVSIKGILVRLTVLAFKEDAATLVFNALASFAQYLLSTEESFPIPVSFIAVRILALPSFPPSYIAILSSKIASCVPGENSTSG